MSKKETNVHKQELTSPDCSRNWNKNHIVWIICKIFKISLHEDFILGVRLFRLYDTLLTPWCCFSIFISKSFSKSSFSLDLIANICSMRRIILLQYSDVFQSCFLFSIKFPIFACLTLTKSPGKVRHCNTWWYCPVTMETLKILFLNLLQFKQKKPRSKHATFGLCLFFSF